MTPYNVIRDERSVQPINVKKAERHYNATFVGDFCLKTKDGTWSEEPAAIFWVETPSKPEYSNYFGLFVRSGSIYITDGQSAFSEPMCGVVTPSGDVLVSRYRHDYREEEGVFIDGGRDYVRTNGKTVGVRAEGPQLIVVEP